jgi:hypothetical protein
MNADQSIKKFFKLTNQSKFNLHNKLPVKTPDLYNNHVEIINHDTLSSHQTTKNYNNTNRQQIVFMVNIIIDKRIYAKHYKGAHTLYMKKKGFCYFLIEPLFNEQVINIHTNFI